MFSIVVSYLLLPGSSKLPLVVHGQSGSGKTSVLSMVLKCCTDWFNSDVAVVVRYLGTTPDSSLLRRLLESLCQQISILLNQNYTAANQKVCCILSCPLFTVLFISFFFIYCRHLAPKCWHSSSILLVLDIPAASYSFLIFQQHLTRS